MSDDPAPYFDTHVFCCTHERSGGKASCGARHSDRLRGYLKDKMKEAGIRNSRINASGCLDRCDLGPVMVIYPEGVWYHYDDHADIDEIFETHIRQGGRVERLLLPPGH